MTHDDVKKQLLPALRHKRLTAERESVRDNARPGAPGEMPLNGLAARHLLEPISPDHRDESQLDLTPMEVEDEKARIRMLYQRAFLRPNLSFSDLAPYRVRVAYRWVREAAVLKSLVHEDQLLADALLGGREDPWHDGNVGAAPPRSSWSQLRADVVDLLNGDEENIGVPLLPPAVPEDCRDEDGLAREDYNPKIDREYMRWIKTFERVTTYLGVMRGSAENPDEGRYGMYGMLDPHSLRLAFPSPVQIMTWEEMLVRECWNHMVAGGQRSVEATLRDTYGLHDQEIGRLVRLARAHGQMAFSTDIEADRALICARLEDLALRCREGVPDERAELQCYKALALIRGVTRSEVDDFTKEVTAIVRKHHDPGKIIDVPAVSRPSQLEP